VYEKFTFVKNTTERPVARNEDFSISLLKRLSLREGQPPPRHSIHHIPMAQLLDGRHCSIKGI